MANQIKPLFFAFLDSTSAYTSLNVESLIQRFKNESYTKNKTHPNLILLTPQKKFSWHKCQSRFNKHVSISEYWNWCVFLHCHGNRIRKTLPTDSVNQSKKIYSGLSCNRHCKDHWVVILGKVQGRRNKTGEV